MEITALDLASAELLGPTQAALDNLEILVAVIRRAPAGRGRQVVSTKDGVVYARLLIGNHTADIRFAYDNRGIDLRTIDSVNLKYRIRGNGIATIHRNTNHWVNNIKRDILVKLGHDR
ncbi:hypothetical protein [Acanthopleuribacter pedis]|uniref:Uncharacterized protein n=1 Tax=Acanthopleuribacter pedis TaxID=442870 RepID=A0A8J7PZS3_9BACT|nr:hypothetical protein [Acanthopleuribacter pedis]MBO1317752.1 hypothetical protein [Acanthopleuribacter pedis]